jgi:hypothetical protein
MIHFIALKLLFDSSGSEWKGIRGAGNPICSDWQLLKGESIPSGRVGYDLLLRDIKPEKI